MSKYERTINWDDYWETNTPSDLEEMKQGGKDMADRLEQFFDEFPNSFLSVGCGFAFTLFTLADRHPDTTFVGVDTSRSVIIQNRKRANNQGIENLTFNEGKLPELTLNQTFESVYCYATLHYVADTESAVQSLYTHVQPGGTLIFHYPNHTHALRSGKVTTIR